MTSELAVIHAVDRVVTDANWELASRLIGLTNATACRATAIRASGFFGLAGQETVIQDSLLLGAFAERAVR